jgi:hypothetical protein
MKARGCGKSMDWMLMVIGRCRMFAAACILPFVIGICTPVHAQQFGGNSPRTKWKQIDTDTARIIFPENLDAQAQRVANTVHYLKPPCKAFDRGEAIENRYCAAKPVGCI